MQYNYFTFLYFIKIHNILTGYYNCAAILGFSYSRKKGIEDRKKIEVLGESFHRLH